MYVIGTAGHIDHGKSTLIRRLTGIDPDRLDEEQARGMTIDLGFAWMELPSGRAIGLVDVPGHHRFIRNMLAGVGSISLTLFVVAATEGWMPQSQEHLEILDLLHVHRGIIVLTKCDLVDEEWLLLVEEDVREAVQGTGLAEAPIVRVASTTGQGIDELVDCIDTLLHATQRTYDIARPRLWIDRVFSIRGAGSVVTGTLVGGSLHVDQSVTLFPAEANARIRQLQMHGRDVAVAEPGNRVAVNLSGVDRDQVHRGDVLGTADERPTDRVNASLRLLPGAEKHFKGLAEYHLYLGSAERMGLVRLLGADRLDPGTEGLLQIALNHPLTASIGDRFILRDETVQRTLGGGVILDAQPRTVRRKSLRYVKKRSKQQMDWLWPERLDPAAQLARAGAPPEDLIRLIAEERGVITRDDLRRQIPVRKEVLLAGIESLEKTGKVVAVRTHILSQQAWDRLTERLMHELCAYHRRYPLRQGVAKESVRSQLGVDSRLFDEAVSRWGRDKMIGVSGAVIWAKEHEPQLTDEQQRICRVLLKTIADHGVEAPTVQELTVGGHDQELISWLVSQQELVRVGDYVYTQGALSEIKAKVAQHIDAHGTIDVASLRDMLQTSRRYALPLLEYLDEINYTRRVGDTRVLA